MSVLCGTKTAGVHGLSAVSGSDRHCREWIIMVDVALISRLATYEAMTGWTVGRHAGFPASSNGHAPGMASDTLMCRSRPASNRLVMGGASMSIRRT